MSSFDLKQAQHYIQLLKGDANADVHWQFYCDSKESKKAVDFYCSLNDALDNIQRYQKEGLGVYVTVNRTDGNGRKLQNITDMEWCFADLDGVALPATFPLLPNFITGRDNEHTHVYWSIKDCITTDQYISLQRRIALYSDSDQQVIDPCRVLRLAGSLHLKDRANPKQYTVMYDNKIPHISYTIDEVVNAFKLTPEKQSKLDKWIESRESINDGSGFTDDPTYIAHAKHYYSTLAKPCVDKDGTSSTQHLIRVAHFGRDRGLSKDVNSVLLWDNFNPRCEPPWSEKEKSHFFDTVGNAYIYACNAAGCETAAGIFMNAGLDPIPEPSEGWEQHYINGAKNKSKPVIAYVEPTDQTLGNVSHNYAAMTAPTLTDRSKDHLLARVFLGLHYPDRRLINNADRFYAYDGKGWKFVDSSAIVYDIEVQFNSLELSISKVQNILKKIAVFTTYKGELKKRTWLQNTYGVDNSCMVTDNGIVHIDNAGKMELYPHSQTFFDMQPLKYSYDPNAKCPQFDKFIADQFSADCIIMIQEIYGVMMMGDNSFQIIPAFIGKTRSGKGVHQRIITGLIGDSNISTPNLEGLALDNKLLDLTNTKVALISEANNLRPAIANVVLDNIKTISGNDSLSLDQKYKSAVKCSDWAIITLFSNSLPVWNDPSNALATRLVPIPFLKSYAGREDINLVDKLTSGDEMSGIANWAAEGYARAKKRGSIYRSKLSREFTQDIRDDTFILSKFVNEVCVLENGKEISVDDFYNYYTIHCNSQKNANVVGYRRFVKELSATPLPIQKVRHRDGNGVRTYKFVGVDVDVSRLQSPTLQNTIDATSRFKGVNNSDVGDKNGTK